MKLGYFLPFEYDIVKSDAAFLRKMKDMGFSGVTSNVEGLASLSQETCQAVKQKYEEVGLELPELGEFLLNFISPDLKVRATAIETLKRSLQSAAWMECPVVIVGSGSLHPNLWFDHKENHSWKSFDLLVRSLRQCVNTAADVGVSIALECHTYTALDSPERVRDVLDAVDSPMLKVDLDPVNWITYATYWDNGPFLHHMFDLLDDNLMGGHAKDVRQEDGLIVHLNETYAGDGNLNYGVYLTRMAELAPDIYLVMENTLIDKASVARDYILREAEKVGVNFVT
jgi:L-ribulose-5-phosphate 3-epimerase